MGSTTAAGAAGDAANLEPLAHAVGSRARALRLTRHLTLDDLSAASGVSRRLIALLEAGEANPSLGTLDKLARALEVDLRSLMLGPPTAPLQPEKAQRLVPVWQDGRGSSARLLVSYSSVGRAELWQWDLVPEGRYQGEADPPGSEEVIVVSAGRLVVEVEGEQLEVGEGAYLRLPTDRSYSYFNPGPGVARFMRAFLSG